MCLWGYITPIVIMLWFQLNNINAKFLLHPTLFKIIQSLGFFCLVLSPLFFPYDSLQLEVMYLHIIVSLIKSTNILKPLPGYIHTLR